jgi:hypothetical protein
LCQNGACSEAENQTRRAVLLRAIQHDRRILTYLRRHLDQKVALQADIIAQKITSRQMSEDDLFADVRLIDSNLSHFMEEEIQAVTDKLIKHNTAFLTEFEGQENLVARELSAISRVWETGKLAPTTQGAGLPNYESVGSGEADLFISGLENSLWLGSENFKTLLHTFFPEMVIETDSANKALNLRPGDRRRVGRRTVAWVVSKSGATSPTKNLVPILKSIMPQNVFAMTGRVDTLIGLMLGQRYYKGAPFSNRILPLGRTLPMEVSGSEEVEVLLNQIELVIYFVEEMKRLFPHQRPWGLDVSQANIQKLKEWRSKVLAKAQRLTGFDTREKPVKSAENEQIIKNGGIYGKMLTETSLVKFFNGLYVYYIINWGTPIIGVLGLPFFLHNLLAYTLVMVMPWLITRILRRFTGRAQVWSRMGAPKTVIGDLPAVNQIVEINASKRGAMAIGSMDADYHGGNARDHFGPRFLHRVRRGSVLIFGIPEEPHARKTVSLTASQANVRNDMTVGLKWWDRLISFKLFNSFAGGPEIFTIGHGDFDPNITLHHMNIGPLETVETDKDGVSRLRPDVTETLSQFYENSFEILDRMIAYNVFFNKSYDHTTQEVLWWKLLRPVLKMAGISRQRIFNPWESLSKTGVLSTPSPESGPRKPLPPYHSGDVFHHLESEPPLEPDYQLPKQHNYQPPQAKEPEYIGFGDKAQLAQHQSVNKGGIDMNSRLMDIKVTEDRPSDFTYNRQVIMPKHIEIITPGTITITPVTRNMLRLMLGEINPN